MEIDRHILEKYIATHLCKIGSHKWIFIRLGLGGWQFFCERCGKTKGEIVFID